MRKAIIIVSVILAVVIVFWQYFSQKSALVDKKASIKIGVIATLSGVGAYQGEQSLKGVMMARDDINSKGGINGRKIELIIEDSKTEPTSAVSAIKKLIEIDGVKFVIGDSWTATTFAIVPIANENKIILISPLATLDELAKDDLFFRTMPKTKDMMVALANYVYSNLGSRRVGILRQDTPFGVEHAVDFREAFEAVGGKIVAEEKFEITATDLRTQITKVKSKNPDTIFNLHATGPMMGLLIKQAKELGVSTQWIGSWGTENGALLKEYGDVIDGLIYPYPYDLEERDEIIKEFTEQYEHKYNELPDLSVVNSYDALKILATAINQTGSDNPIEIKRFLSSLKEYRGVSGIISFDKNGDVQKPIIIKQIKNGHFIKK